MDVEERKTNRASVYPLFNLTKKVWPPLLKACVNQNSLVCISKRGVFSEYNSDLVLN